MVQSILDWLEQTAHAVPLPIFVMVGGIIEEIVAPIPSPLVATLTGSIAAIQYSNVKAVLFMEWNDMHSR